jgi:uncharacterized protein
MCGGFALLIGNGARSLGHNVARQIVYSLGRIFTYGFAGAALGFVGLRLNEVLPSMANTQAALAIVAGLFLVVQGLVTLGIIPRGLMTRLGHRFWSRPADCTAPDQLVLLSGATAASFSSAPLSSMQSQSAQQCANLGCSASIFGPFLQARSLGGVFLAGMLTGFLPCGLIYAYLALAASAASLPRGGALMVAFGLGTVPMMVLAGSGPSLVSLATRGRLYRAAAWCVVLTGLLSLARGASYISLPGDTSAKSCPMCL